MTETLGSILAEASRAIAAAGCSEARRRARHLIGSALGIGSSELLVGLDREVGEREARYIRFLLDRVLRCEPLSRVLGRREFWGIEFGLSADTLDPRPDTEAVVEAVLRRIPERDAPLRLLDLGTGTGCLLLALLSELPKATGLAVDIGVGAAATARMNAAALGLASRAWVSVGDWGKALATRFAVVVFNPPYISWSGLAALPRAVRGYDPRRALDGGDDGLEAFRAISAELPRLLTPDGIFVTEVGIGQIDAVAAILDSAGLAIRGIEPDLAGVARCVVGGRPCDRPAVARRRAKKLLACSITPSRLRPLDCSPAPLQSAAACQRPGRGTAGGSEPADDAKTSED
jgi:release factor glutamine methyltransferase